MTKPARALPARFGRAELEAELHRLLAIADLGQLTSAMIALGDLELERIRESAGRLVTVDIDQLPELIATSIKTVLATRDLAICADPILPDPPEMPIALRLRAGAHPARLTIPETFDVLRELGNNVAGVIALVGAEPPEAPEARGPRGGGSR